MKRLCLVLLMVNVVSTMFAQDITGQWWRLDRERKEYDELFIDENLQFTLKAVIGGKAETLQARINVIGGEQYYAHVNYNGVMKNAYLYRRDRDRPVYLILYENETDDLYRGRFTREKEPVPDEKADNKAKGAFDVMTTFGSFNGEFGFFKGGGHEYALSVNTAGLLLLHDKTRLQAEITPVTYSYGFSSRTQRMSFINVSLEWNALDLLVKGEGLADRVLFLGPSLTLNWLNLYDFKTLDVKDAVFSAGLKFSWTELPLKWLTLEAGYRNAGRTHGYYVTVQVGSLFPFLAASTPFWFPVMFGTLD